MKLFISLLFLSFSVFAQDYSWPDYPHRRGPFPERFPPHRDEFCTGEEIEATRKEVANICSEKLVEFQSKHLVTCETTSVSLRGCRAVCKREAESYANLRLDVFSNCLLGKARLRKTVVKYF